MTAATLRDLDGMEDFLAAERLQTDVWGPGDKIDPADLMMVIAAEGGLAAGAFRDDVLLGYVFAFPTVTPGVQHSHRLATHPAARGMGLGVALKWYQRDWCLARGIHHVRWTFDPLRHVNAGLNIARLGGTSATYYPNYYGEMAGINQGVPSDRLLVDWPLQSPIVIARAAGAADGHVAGGVRVAIDPNFETLLLSDPDQALTLRLQLRKTLMDHFAQGLHISGYDPVAHSYCLTRLSATDG
jgi:predicted GNAT superfamily acetyltransferase